MRVGRAWISGPATRGLVILGAGELARQIIGVLDDVNQQRPAFHLIGLLDDGSGGGAVDGVPVLGGDELLASLDADYIIGVGTPGLRRRLGEFADRCGRQPASLIHSASWVDRRAEVGSGALITENAHVQYGAVVGRHAIVNLNSVVGHDSCLGDHVAVAGNVIIGARAHVGDDVLVGMGSVVLGDVEVGNRAVIGAGAVVTKDVPADATVVGNPARRLVCASSGATVDGLRGTR